MGYWGGGDNSYTEGLLSIPRRMHTKFRAVGISSFCCQHISLALLPASAHRVCTAQQHFSLLSHTPTHCRGTCFNATLHSFLPIVYVQRPAECLPDPESTNPIGCHNILVCPFINNEECVLSVHETAGDVTHRINYVEMYD